jgi:hypothetical protein
MPGNISGCAETICIFLSQVYNIKAASNGQPYALHNGVYFSDLRRIQERSPFFFLYLFAVESRSNASCDRLPETGMCTMLASLCSLTTNRSVKDSAQNHSGNLGGGGGVL